jgi:hypothetical protein
MQELLSHTNFIKSVCLANESGNNRINYNKQLLPAPDMPGQYRLFQDHPRLFQL